jgi:bacterioferritin-associated ferredoxin
LQSSGPGASPGRIEWENAAVYVCLCNGLTERDIRAAARSLADSTGSGSVDEVYRRLGGAPVCCACIETAQAIIQGLPIIDGRPILDRNTFEANEPELAVADAA